MEGKIKIYQGVDAIHVSIYKKIYIKITISESKESGSRFLQVFVSDNPTHFSREMKQLKELTIEEFKTIITKEYEPFEPAVEDFLKMIEEA